MLWTDTICSNHLTKCLCLLYNCYKEPLIAAGFKVSWDTTLSIISDVFFSLVANYINIFLLLKLCNHTPNISIVTLIVDDLFVVVVVL